MNQLIDILHILLCTNPHIYDMLKISNRQPGFCYYYLESDISDGDTMPDHIKWEEITTNFKTSLSLSTDEEALEFIKQAIKISQEIKTLTGGNQDRFTFIAGLLT